ncbi:MAG: hypothetical protein LBI57_01960 [Helicobacteraceae bacterium]|jgi:hypothetical protein|nr:hypothetical protein [Helicobacteraceae bacterium]
MKLSTYALFLVFSTALFGAGLYDSELCVSPLDVRANERGEKGVLSVGGSASFRGAYQFDYDNAPDPYRQSRLRGSFEAKCVNKNGFFRIIASATKEEAKQAAARSDAELSEAYFQTRLSDAADIKIGRQIVVWGKSDMLRVTDALNPLDMQEPAMSDIGDLRLGVAMARLDYYIGDWNLQAIAIPETRFTKRPRTPSEFSPYSLSDTNKPEGVQGALAAIGVFEGWDLSLYAASLFADEVRDHKRNAMLGAAAAVAIGDFVIKTETALWRENGFDSKRFDLLIGAEYAGVRDATIAFEMMTRFTKNDDREGAFSTRIQRDLLNASLRLSATATINLNDGESGGAARLQGDYDMADNYLLTIGYVDYFGSLEPYKSFDRNARAFAQVKVSF